ncbi:FAD-binding domain-containing protein [Gloeopeniophorella convolvens]|nr:FAD-binding domain-containing protein [Gloeopeniophorella convolvens]
MQPLGNTGYPATFPVAGVPGLLGQDMTMGIQAACNKIAASISNASQVFFPSSPQYDLDIAHNFVTSSQASACSVEPGSVEDVSTILRIIGATRSPFAVKSGGHTANPGFSSTDGIHISMARFKDITLDHARGTVDVGSGVTWDEVYDKLESTGFGVVGGRMPGVAVAGMTLGGGYTHRSNQFGLAMDNVAAFELVLPDGTITKVTSENEDLWWALRGCMNNFGIVTKLTLNTHPEGQIWGGGIIYPGDQLDAMKSAMVKFQEHVTDPKAALYVSVAWFSSGIAFLGVFYYDGPTPPEGIFDDFLSIPFTTSDVSSRSYANFVHRTKKDSVDLSRFRAFYDTVPVTNYSIGVMDAIINQTTVWGKKLVALDEKAVLGIAMEPFSRGMLAHGSPSAWPPDRSRDLFPTLLSPLWTNSSLDGFVVDMLHEISDSIRAAALADGQDVSDAPLYPNYALFDTPVEDIYGANLPRLRAIKREVDPDDVMGLAGGFKL